MDFDIVIVNHNSGGHLRACLASVAAARLAKHRISRIIVVDNASRDGSDADLFGDNLPLIVRHEPCNIGFGAACNRGAAMGNAPAVLFLNPDVTVSKDAIEMAVSTLLSRDDVAIVGGRLCYGGAPRPSRMCFPTAKHLIAKSVGLHALFPKRFPDHFDLPQHHSGDSDAVIGAFFLVRRTAFAAVGGFDERFFLYYEEIDLAQRLHAAGWRCFYHAGITASHAGGVCAQTNSRLSRQHARRSRTIYAKRYFSRRQAFAVALTSYTIEPILRGTQALFRRGKYEA